MGGGGVVEGVGVAMPFMRADEVDDGIKAIGVCPAGEADVFGERVADPFFETREDFMASWQVVRAVFVADAGVAAGAEELAGH